MLCLNTYFVLVMTTAYVHLQYAFLAITGIRLFEGPHENEGTLQVQVHGFWGTVCHGYWGVDESNVACRHLGYSKALSFRIITHPGSKMPNWLEKVNCIGREEFIWDCNYNGIGPQDGCWGNDEFVYLVCDPNKGT